MSDLKQKTEEVLAEFMSQRLHYDIDTQPIGLATKSYELIKELTVRETKLVAMMTSDKLKEEMRRRIAPYLTLTADTDNVAEWLRYEIKMAIKDLGITP